jgi:hypothetical protein
MAQQEKPLSEQEGLQIIQQMIRAAKQEQKDDGMGWIVWGWLLFLASLFTLLNLNRQWVSAYFFWNIFGVVAVVWLLFATLRKIFIKPAQKVKTYTKDLCEKLNIGFLIFLLLIIFSMNLGVFPMQGFALLLGLYGFWMLIHGTILNFKPSIAGAFITWGFAFAGLYVPSFEWTMLLHTLAVLCGFIIPGHMAYAAFNKVKLENKE